MVNKNKNEMTRELPGGLQSSNTRGPPMTRYKQLSNLGRLCVIKPKFRIDLGGDSSSVLDIN